jgi:PPK2 family polyphosphate:nucleotide phosphotransferase
VGKLSDFDHLRVAEGKKFRLKDHRTDSTRGVPKREEADAATAKTVEQLGKLQDALYAEGRQSLLVILQGMDAAGKDGAVRKIFDAVNPTGVQVWSFKTPTSEELRHDFLWRCHAKAPPRGYIGIFNRSHYEDVLVVRVHADRLLAPELRGDKGEWDRRYNMIRDFENILTNASTRVVKFFLHISKEEQRERLIERQKDPAKHWKLCEGDFVERKFWDDYQEAYEIALPKTSTRQAPWYVIPSDNKWVRNYWVSHIVAATLKEMDPKPPLVSDPALVTRRFE